MTEQEELDYEMRPEYDMSKAVRNPYLDRPRRNEAYMVTIAPDLRTKFPSSDAVNEALRSFLKMKEQEAA